MTTISTVGGGGLAPPTALLPDRLGYGASYNSVLVGRLASCLTIDFAVSATFVERLNVDGPGYISFLAMFGITADVGEMTVVIDGVTVLDESATSTLNTGPIMAIGGFNSAAASGSLSADHVKFNTNLTISCKNPSSAAFIGYTYYLT
jgi:hypothetical protein|tara:strand:+ start:756 stop:1199 length:444 start_codon:yes stop_codon:yes gene_type:complete